MSTQIYDKWFEMSRAASAPFAQWNEFASKSIDKATEHTLALAKDYLELGTRQFQLLGEVKDPQKWIAEESKLFSEFGQKLVGRASEVLQAAKETREAFSSLAESTAKTAVEAVAAKAA